MNFKKSTELKRGDLVEYKDPLPQFTNMFGVVLNVSEISSNVYERGYIEATVRWNTKMWNTKEEYVKGRQDLFETFEDVDRLQKISK